MSEYEFTLIVNRDPTDLSEELFDVGQGDLVPEGGPAGNVVHVSVAADTFAAAISAAVHNIERVGLQVHSVASEDLVSLKDIAARTGRTYESVRLLATGKRGPGRFPAAMSTGQWALYSWAEVSTWLAEHYDNEVAGTFDRQIAAADHLIRARRILVADDHRSEMAKLLAA